MIEDNEYELETFSLCKIQCIKMVKAITNLGLVDSKHVVDKFFDLAGIERIHNSEDFDKLLKLSNQIKEGVIRINGDDLIVSHYFGPDDFEKL